MIDGGEIEAIASFRNAEGEVCREIELARGGGETVVSVACRAEDGWRSRFAVVTGAGGTGFAPASSLDTLDTYLGAIGAGAPLSLEDEAAALGGEAD